MRQAKGVSRGTLLAAMLGATLALHSGFSAAAGKDLSKDAVKKACRSQAKAEGMETGDFGDVEYQDTQSTWVAKLNVRGSGDKFKANCLWSGSGTPTFTVAGSGEPIASKKYSKEDVNQHCKKQALSEGMEVGDFGDTEWKKNQQQWVAVLKVKENNSEKRKTNCTWDGHGRPVIQ
jgi:hypothetical protein